MKKIIIGIILIFSLWLIWFNIPCLHDYKKIDDKIANHIHNLVKDFYNRHHRLPGFEDEKEIFPSSYGQELNGIKKVDVSGHYNFDGYKFSLGAFIYNEKDSNHNRNYLDLQIRYKGTIGNYVIFDDLTMVMDKGREYYIEPCFAFRQ